MHGIIEWIVWLTKLGEFTALEEGKTEGNGNRERNQRGEEDVERRN